MKTILTFGVYDMLHLGHILLFKRAKELGDSWVQLWEFPEQGDSVSVSIYNTIRREFHSNPETSFKFRYRY